MPFSALPTTYKSMSLPWSPNISFQQPPPLRFWHSHFLSPTPTSHPKVHFYLPFHISTCVSSRDIAYLEVTWSTYRTRHVKMAANGGESTNLSYDATTPDLFPSTSNLPKRKPVAERKNDDLITHPVTPKRYPHTPKLCGNPYFGMSNLVPFTQHSELSRYWGLMPWAWCLSHSESTN